MHVTAWIVLAFILGVLFGRMLGRGSNSARVSGSATTGMSFKPAAQPVQIGDPNGAYLVTLLERGPNIINTIKAVREVTRLDLKGSKDLVDAVPSQLIRVSSADHANAVARVFQGIAPLRIDGPAGYSQPVDYGYRNAAGRP